MNLRSIISSSHLSGIQNAPRKSVGGRMKFWACFRTCWRTSCLFFAHYLYVSLREPDAAARSSPLESPQPFPTLASLQNDFFSSSADVRIPGGLKHKPGSHAGRYCSGFRHRVTRLPRSWKLQAADAVPYRLRVASQVCLIHTLSNPATNFLPTPES